MENANAEEERKLNNTTTTRESRLSMEKKLFLLRELREIENQLKKNSEIPDYPFVEIFSLYKKGHTRKYIARKLKVKMFDVDSIIHGGITIPSSQIIPIKKLGFKICQCCRKRIVPLVPIGYTKLTRLCKICYKRGSEEVYNVNHHLWRE